MAADTFLCEIRIRTIGLQLSTAPSGPAPAQGGRVFLAITNHELDLVKLAGMNDAGIIGELFPGNFCESRAVGPGIDLIVDDGIEGDIVAKNLANGVIVKTIRA